MTAQRQFATFRLGELLLGVPVLSVQEVIRFQPLTPVPLAPAAMRGLMNLRGQIVPAIDLRRQLELPPRQDETSAMNLVVGKAHEIVSFLIDEIGEVVEVEQAALEAIPENISPVLREALLGIYKLPGQLLLALDPERTANLATGTRVRGGARAAKPAETATKEEGQP